MPNKFVLNETSYHGKGAIAEIPNEIKGRGIAKVLVCSDPGLVQFGVTKKVTDLLEGAGIEYQLYTNIQPNPTIENVQSGVKTYREYGAEGIVAIGGGSSMDTAKAIGIIIANPEHEDVVSLGGVVNTRNHVVPLFAVPTTAGTAAEVTASYVITDPENRGKVVCIDGHCVPHVAFVDPDMMSSMPKGLTAFTGMDALTHAIEGYITPGAWELSDPLNLKAIQLVAKHLRSAVNGEEEGRRGMAIAEYLAGMGFSNVGLGLDHAIAHILGGFYGIPHGKACTILLPSVMEFNRDYTGEKYRDIAGAFGVEDALNGDLETVKDEAIAEVKKLAGDIGIELSFRNDIREEDLDAIAEGALKDACAGNNPRPFTAEDVKTILRGLM